MTRNLKSEDLRRAMIQLHRVMGKGRWSWDEMEAFLGGVLSFDYSGDDIVGFFRGVEPAPSAGMRRTQKKMETDLGKDTTARLRGATLTPTKKGARKSP